MASRPSRLPAKEPLGATLSATELNAALTALATCEKAAPIREAGLRAAVYGLIRHALPRGAGEQGVNLRREAVADGVADDGIAVRCGHDGKEGGKKGSKKMGGRVANGAWLAEKGAEKGLISLLDS